MTPTAAAPSINTWRAFHGRCAYGCNTARRRINLYTFPLLFSLMLILLFSCSLLLFLLNSLISSLVLCSSSLLFLYSLLLFTPSLPSHLFLAFIHSLFSSFSSFSGLLSYPLLFLLIPLFPSNSLPLFTLIPASPYSSSTSFPLPPSFYAISPQPTHAERGEKRSFEPRRQELRGCPEKCIGRSAGRPATLEARLLTIPSPLRKGTFCKRT